MRLPPSEFKKAPTVLISGASGFIGSELLKRLQLLGFPTHVIVRKSSLHKIKRQGYDKVSVHSFQGSTQELVKIVKFINPTICFHLASFFKPEHQIKDIVSLVESNLLFGTQLAEAFSLSITSSKEKKIFINAGTAWQHAFGEEYYPTSLYAATKQGFQDILTYYNLHRSLRVTHLKLFDTYGPKDPRKKLIPLLLSALQTKQIIKLSEGEQYIDPVYIDDVIDALLKAAELGLKKAQATKGVFSYSISSGNPIKIKSLVKTIEQISGKKLTIEWGSLPYREIEMFEPWHVSPPLPGWKPKTNLEKGLLNLITETERYSRNKTQRTRRKTQRHQR